MKDLEWLLQIITTMNFSSVVVNIDEVERRIPLGCTAKFMPPSSSFLQCPEKTSNCDVIQFSHLANLVLWQENCVAVRWIVIYIYNLQQLTFEWEELICHHDLMFSLINSCNHFTKFGYFLSCKQERNSSVAVTTFNFKILDYVQIHYALSLNN